MSGLFGTDSARGVTVAELSCEQAMQAGRAAAELLVKEQGGRIIVAKDKRLSSDVLEAAVCAGICSSGIDAETLGAVPAAAASYIVREHSASAGIMITGAAGSGDGSGIRLIAADGFRLDERVQSELEENILSRMNATPQRKFDNIGRMLSCDNAAKEYVSHIKQLIGTDLSGLRAAIICEEPSTAATAEKLFRELGADVFLLSHQEPEEDDLAPAITDMERLMDFVAGGSFCCGLAIGDNGGSCLAVDENGMTVDGDHLLAIFAKHFKDSGRLKDDTFVVNQMSGLGLFNFAKENGIKAVTSGASGRSALDRMLEGGFSLGGDRNGHVFFTEDSPCEDGLLCGARLLEIIKMSGRPLSVLAEEMQRLPSISLNVRIADTSREIWKNDKDITDLIEWYQGEFGDKGRVIVRESNAAAPFITITIEGSDFGRINDIAGEIAERIRQRCGARE
ncbi:MAG TPA: phosphoglucosamine mutase [Ruminococcus sp.]|nr:phosphoglucosamine mutase [Ruminococcus sp.]